MLQPYQHSFFFRSRILSSLDLSFVSPLKLLFTVFPPSANQVPALALESPVVIGMGWDVDDDIAMDLDCGLAVYSGDQRTDYCDFEKLETNDQACQHQGDNRNGEG